MTAAGAEPSDLLRVANLLADAAAGVTLPLFRSPALAADDKGSPGRFDPVTEADRAAETAMRDILARERPDDAILGEEAGRRPGTTGLTWVLDPIDGTRAFISGLPVWGTLIAVDAGTGPVIGIIDQPYTGERFIGGPGVAELRRSGRVQALRVRPCGGLADATLFSTFPEVGTPAEATAFRAVSAGCRLTRFGTDCYAYALLALGQIDLVIEAGLQSYDIEAPIAVISAAGGIVTDWQGGPAHQGGRVLAAGDARCHAAALEILSQVA
jgi:myo-inositol-1(or 4)-monophosphatase